MHAATYWLAVGLVLVLVAVWLFCAIDSEPETSYGIGGGWNDIDDIRVHGREAARDR
jgi:hypothetical protein